MSGRLLCQIMQLSLGNIQGLRKQINIYKGEGRKEGREKGGTGRKGRREILGIQTEEGPGTWASEPV